MRFISQGNSSTMFIKLFITTHHFVEEKYQLCYLVTTHAEMMWPQIILQEGTEKRGR